MEDGFKLGGPYVPGMGWHFNHPEQLRTAAKEGVDIEKPPVLTYLDNNETEGLTLASVEYAVPKAQETPDLFDDESAEATEEWVTHEAATHVFANRQRNAEEPERAVFRHVDGKDELG